MKQKPQIEEEKKEPAKAGLSSLMISTKDSQTKFEQFRPYDDLP